jgi:hypothetical protein
MPLIETKGAASAQGFGEFATSAEKLYIESCFSTYLYTGTGASQTITNGIDLSGKGGLVWFKSRSGAYNHALIDTARGGGQVLSSNATSAQADYSPQGISAFNTNGFTFGTTTAELNNSSNTYVSWTFRKQPKFFDVVTYTGTGVAGRTVAHNLGSVPGFIIVKSTTTAVNWRVYHRSESSKYASLNSTAAFQTTNAQNVWGNNSTTISPTSTEFTVGTDSALNASGDSYVAYLFAHDAGGFGLSGTDNVISCGSFTGSGAAGNAVTLGYEPQWVMIKRVDSTGNWNMQDVLRQMSLTNNFILYANLSDAEFDAGGAIVYPTATGFTLGTGSAGWNASGGTYIYIAIRRGPMKVPTSGTSVYEGTAYTGNGASNRQIGSSVLTDLLLLDSRDATAQSWSTYAQIFFDRLRGQGVSLATASTAAEVGGWSAYFNLDMNAGWDTGTTASQDYLNKSGSTYVSHAFRRAPGFFDVVCFAGGSTNAARTYTHNLGVQPELIIVKERNVTGNWYVATNQGAKSGESIDTTKNHTGFQLNGTAAVTFGTTQNWSDVCSSTVFVTNGAASYITDSAGNTAQWSVTSTNFVAYLFASCPGVSKVGSYTGTGTTLQIDCGFTGGARLVLIKRTDSTGDWYVYDTARGIVSGNDSYLLLNSTAAEVTNTDYVDTYSAGFELSSTAPAGLNANGGTYIFLAIA